ncbi:Bax protein [Idiomarina fontislapidosi]|uniref:Peptidoglycan hydrolase n=1 Tax=Idiomarina fontislapidosi TaxID=263723 RepID=A0A432Y9N9_9GAMM|nr:glucosaminidase domain-containing protein [Idiomarina fontislapidosi]PYE34362.1 Bax protein [Idiomarina fontislapidosi]RUO57678.1 peptidoglycan hydrolase [Idiomarina fontislapidosi]
MRKKLFIIFFILVCIAALLLPFFSKYEKPASEKDIASHGLPPIPTLAPRTEIPNFDKFNDVREKKKEFFRYLLPVIEAENLRILHERQQLLAIESAFSRGFENEQDKKQLARLVDYYEVDPTLDSAEQFELLKRRVDIIPTMMVLVQAANESAWGMSRFAQEGLNLFGQWCYREGCGLVPEQRPEGMNHEVAKFDHVAQSVRSYMRNINTHDPYLELRQIRQVMRQRDEQVRAIPLLSGLHSYSERGQDYIDELKAMIRVNRPIVDAIIEQEDAATSEAAAASN